MLKANDDQIRVRTHIYINMYIYIIYLRNIHINIYT